VKTLARERREPVLEFQLLRRLAYGPRMVLAATLTAVGLGWQVYSVSFWPGGFFLLAAVLLGWVVGFDNRVDKRAFHHDVAWEPAPLDRLRKIRDLDRSSRRWDSSALDASNPFGFVMFLFAAMGIGVAALASGVAAGARVAPIVAGDGALLLLSQWFSGMRFRFRQPDLMIKVEHALAVMGVDPRGEPSVLLRMQGKDEARIPTDLKLAVRYEDAPPHFLGVQAQIVLNRVQGAAYPYFYAVVVSREGHGLLADAARVTLPQGVILETKTEDGVDVAVVRQYTTKTSGYHTKPATSRKILSAALDIADLHLRRTAAGSKA